MVDSLVKRMSEVIINPKTKEEQLVFFEKRIRENQKLSESKSMKSLFLFIVTSFAWVIIRSAAIEKLSFFGMEFVDLRIPLLALPPIAAFFFYSFHSYLIISELISEVLRKYYDEKLEPFRGQNLIELLAYPTLLNIEKTVFFMRKMDKLSIINSTFTIIIAIIILYFPVPFLLWMSYNLITSPNIEIQWSIGSIVLTLFIMVRGLLMDVNFSTLSDPRRNY